MILFASRRALLRKRWRQALGGSCPIHEVNDQTVLRKALILYKPAVLFVDSELIRHRGIRQLAQLCRTSPRTGTIFFTESVNDREGVAVLKAGAKGYCAEKIPGASLKKAVWAVNKGEIWTDRRLLSLLVEILVTSRLKRNTVLIGFGRRTAASLDALSPRERDIASLISVGKRNKFISSQLSISEKTVKAHITKIFRKLGVSSRTQLALWCARTILSPRSSGQPPRFCSI